MSATIFEQIGVALAEDPVRFWVERWERIELGAHEFGPLHHLRLESARAQPRAKSPGLPRARLRHTTPRAHTPSFGRERYGTRRVREPPHLRPTIRARVSQRRSRRERVHHVYIHLQALGKKVNGVLCFVLDGTKWTVDCKSSEVRPGAPPKADCTVTIGEKDFVNLASGKAKVCFRVGE